MLKVRKEEEIPLDVLVGLVLVGDSVGLDDDLLTNTLFKIQEKITILFQKENEKGKTQ